ncbi:succinyl-CoA:3-ketoacid coenzyme A transferase 2, mitochondrial [Ixodes scapularis]
MLVEALELLVKGRRCLLFAPDGQSVRLKIHWLPPHVPDDEVRIILALYGKVSEVAKEKCHHTGHIRRECRLPCSNQCRQFGRETGQCVRTYTAVAEPVREETSEFLMNEEDARNAEATREEVPGAAPEATTGVKGEAYGDVHQRLFEIVNLSVGVPGGDDCTDNEGLEFEEVPACTDTEKNADIPMPSAGVQGLIRARQTEHVAEGAPKSKPSFRHSWLFLFEGLSLSDLFATSACVASILPLPTSISDSPAMISNVSSEMAFSASLDVLSLSSGASHNAEMSRSTRPIRRLCIYTSADEAVKNIKSRSTVFLGGFGPCGSPEALVSALSKTSVKDLVIISNSCQGSDSGISHLLKTKQVKSVTSSYLGDNDLLRKQYLSGELELEYVPMGSLAEKIRAGGTGIPAFFTPTGYGTPVHMGGVPMRYDGRGGVAVSSQPKEHRVINGQNYIMEHAITGDFALVKAWRADKAGNLVFRRAAQNFNPAMCRAAKFTIAEVEELCEIGDIPPDQVHLPGIYVDGIFRGPPASKNLDLVTCFKPRCLLAPLNPDVARSE